MMHNVDVGQRNWEVVSGEEEDELVIEHQERMLDLKHASTSDSHIGPFAGARAEAPDSSTSRWHFNFYSCQNNKLSISKL